MFAGYTTLQNPQGKQGVKVVGGSALSFQDLKVVGGSVLSFQKGLEGSQMEHKMYIQRLKE